MPTLSTCRRCTRVPLQRPGTSDDAARPQPGRLLRRHVRRPHARQPHPVGRQPPTAPHGWQPAGRRAAWPVLQPCCSRSAAPPMGPQFCSRSCALPVLLAPHCCLLPAVDCFHPSALLCELPVAAPAPHVWPILFVLSLTQSSSRRGSASRACRPCRPAGAATSPCGCIAAALRAPLLCCVALLSPVLAVRFPCIFPGHRLTWCLLLTGS